MMISINHQLKTLFKLIFKIFTKNENARIYKGNLIKKIDLEKLGFLSILIIEFKIK